MLDLVASPNTIHFVVDRERSWKQTISLNSSQPVEKRTMKKKKKATQQTAWNINKWGMLVRSRSRKADPRERQTESNLMILPSHLPTTTI